MACVISLGTCCQEDNFGSESGGSLGMIHQMLENKWGLNLQ